MQAHLPDGGEGAEALHHIGPGLLDDLNVLDDDCQEQDDNNGDCDPHDDSSFFTLPVLQA